MSLDLATVGRRLKEARTNSGVSQEAAAEAIGVPRTAIVHIEAGNRSISTVELYELARLYGRPVAEFLSDAEVSEDEDMLVTLHRLTGESSPAVEQEVRRCVDICREGYELEGLLERRTRSGPPAYDLPAPRAFAEAVEQAEWVAKEERLRLGLGHSPIPDMADLLSCEGIWACGVKLPDEMSGLFLHGESIGLVVLVNYHHPRGRKRFSYAHEYAHSLLDRKRSMNVTMKKNSSELVERRANAFAASFLVPKEGVELFLKALNKGGASRRNFHVYDVTTESEVMETERRTLASTQTLTYQDAALLAAHYGVSYHVAVYRLVDLGYLGRDQIKGMIDQLPMAESYLEAIRRLDEVRGRPTEQDRELVSQVLPLAFEAYRREEISRGKLLELGKLLRIESKKLLSLV